MHRISNQRRPIAAPCNSVHLISPEAMPNLILVRLVLGLAAVMTAKMQIVRSVPISKLRANGRLSSTPVG